MNNNGKVDGVIFYIVCAAYARRYEKIIMYSKAYSDKNHGISNEDEAIGVFIKDHPLNDDLHGDLAMVDGPTVYTISGKELKLNGKFFDA